MRRTFQLIVRLLPLDGPSRRAVDETLNDWRHEERARSRGVRRIVVVVRSMCSVARVLTLVAGSEIGGFPTSPVVHRAMFIVGVLVAMQIGGMWSLVHAGRAIFVDVGVLNGVSLNLPAPAIPAWAAYQLSKWAIAWMPLVLFLAASRSSAQQRQSGILGLALLSIVGSVVATGWAVPFVSAHYRHVAFGFINSPHRPPDFIDPWAILNLPDLLRAMQASGPLTTWELLGQLIERSSATFSGALLLLLASLISRMNGWRAWSVVVFVVAVYWWAPKPLDSFFWHGSIYPRLIGPAVIPMVALSMWFVIASCISRRTVQESSAA